MPGKFASLVCIPTHHKIFHPCPGNTNKHHEYNGRNPVAVIVGKEINRTRCVLKVSIVVDQYNTG
jgi:hypothetical protein